MNKFSLILLACFIKIFALNWNDTVYFDRGMVVSGDFQIELSQDGLNFQLLAFYTDSTSGPKLPKLAEDNRWPWFTISNEKEVRDSLGIKQQYDEEDSCYCLEFKATIKLSKYHYIFKRSDVVNSAEISKIIKYEKPQKKKCTYFFEWLNRKHKSQ